MAMKFVISTQEFNYLIGRVLNVAAHKATIPILSNILIEAKGNELMLTATDLTVGMRCITEAKVLEEGATTLPAKKLAQLVKELTSVNIEVSSNERDVTEIIADASVFRLNGMSKGEYPTLPDMESAVKFSIEQSQLKDMLFRTSFAVSKEDNRYVLTGVFLHVEKGRATFVGTDGKRLARTYLPVDLDPEFSGSYVVPLKAIEEIQKCLKDEGTAVVYLMQDKIAVQSEEVMIITKLLSGEYPDVDRVIPEKPECVVSVHREELISLLRQMSLFTTDTSQSVRFSFSTGELKLSANTAEVGEGNVKMPLNYQGDHFDIAFNPGYVLDILRHSKGETVNMGVTDPFNPGVITDEGVDPYKAQEPSPIFVLMPMRLNDE
jgi:DNA polymerase-3 subunit beta